MRLVVFVLLLVFVGFVWHPLTSSYEEDSVLITSSSQLLNLLEKSPSAETTTPENARRARRQPLQASSPSIISKNQINMSSVRVLFEKDVAKDFFNQTEFEGTYFRSSPPCTPLSVDQVSFTLVTQASMDRLWIMKHQCERWPAPLPISVAVYLPPDSPYDETQVARELSIQLECDLDRMQITVLRGNAPIEQYPVNLLRNLAFRTVTTSHVMYTDSDFLISNGLHDDLMAMAPTMANDSLAAIVVPAFIYHSACPEKFSSKHIRALSCFAQEWEIDVPKNKLDLIRLWEKKKDSKPNVKQGFHGVHFHGSTQYSPYKNQKDPLLIPCISSYLYEPYLAVRLCENLPEFPEVFRGYGWNKNIWILWLTRKLPYKLWQTPRGFVVHLPHETSASWRKRNQPGKTSSSVNPPEHDRYLKWFKNEVPQHPDRIPSCPGTTK